MAEPQRKEGEPQSGAELFPSDHNKKAREDMFKNSNETAYF